MKWKTFFLLFVSVFIAVYLYNQYTDSKEIEVGNVALIYNQLKKYRLLFWVSLSCFLLFGMRTAVVHDLSLYIKDKKFVIIVTGILLLLVVILSPAETNYKIAFTTLYVLTYITAYFVIRRSYKIDQDSFEALFFFVFSCSSLSSTGLWLSGCILYAIISWVVGIIIFYYAHIFYCMRALAEIITRFLKNIFI